MISERQVARGFGALWSEVLPLLTPHFVHLFNEAYRKPLTNAAGKRASVVPSGDDSDPAVVAECAFHLVRLAQKRAIPLSDVANDEQLIADAESYALTLIQEYESPKDDPPRGLNASERIESLLLVQNYELFLSSRTPQVIEFGPSIPGAGFVDTCIGDVSVGDTLFEVKTVSRSIAGKDIRQLLVYLALQTATGQKRWSRAGFFNPRRASVYEFSVDKMIPHMSGGRLASEVFEHMVEHFCARDIQLDSAF